MTAPRRVRPPAVAGTFYPADPETLRSLVESLLAEARERVGSEPAARFVVAPHAGYVYSGPIAASAFSRLPRGLRRIVVLGPAHRVPVRGVALSGADAFATPLGEVAVCPAATRAISSLPQVVTAPAAHAQEHSLEVELPFLQVTHEGAAVLPLVVGDAEPGEVAEVIDAALLDDATGVVVSSDLSHYLPYEVAREVDEETANQVLRLEPLVSYDRACGAGPLNGLLLWARRRGLCGELLDLRSSGDTSSERRQVVGYGAFAFE